MRSAAWPVRAARSAARLVRAVRSAARRVRAARSAARPVRAVERWLPIALSLWLASCASSLVDYTPRVHIVQRGETLFSIAWRYGLDYKEVARWNRLADPDVINVGQRIQLAPPATAGARTPSPSSRTASASSRTPSSTGRTAAARSAPSASPAPRRSPPAPRSAPPPAWHWPTPGAVVSGFGSESGIPSGIGIGGRLGQPIEAAAAGRVVYAGSGLIGYGQLVIIRHNETYLTAYGHNRRLLVQQGQSVARGQKIAEMGLGPKREPRLHFEIRRNGTPVDPLQFMSGPPRVAGAR